MTNRRLISLCLIPILGLSACGSGAKRSESPTPGPVATVTQVLVPSDPQKSGAPFENLFPGTPEVSPDGHFVAFLGGIGYRTALGVVGNDGSITVVTNREEYVHSFAWMPDSRSLLVAYHPAVRDLFTANRFGIWSIDGAFIRNIDSSVGLNVEDGLSVEEDGAFAIVSGTPPPAVAGYGLQADLYRIDLTSGFVDQLTQTTDQDERTPDVVGDDRVFFVRSTGNDEWGRGYVLDLQTQQIQAVTPSDEPVIDATAEGTSNLIVYTTARPGNLIDNDPCFRSVSLSGGQRRKLFCRAARYPDLAADGTWLVVKDIGIFVPPTDPREVPSGGSIVRINLPAN